MTIELCDPETYVITSIHDNPNTWHVAIAFIVRTIDVILSSATYIIRERRKFISLLDLRPEALPLYPDLWPERYTSC